MPWYAAHVKSNFESAASMALDYRNVANFWPHTVRIDDQKRVFRKPFFPGYVFFEADLSTNEAHRKVIEAPSILRIVGSGTEPEAIPEEQIFSVRKVAEFAAIAQRQVEMISASQYQVGDPVLIRRGGLAGVEGRIMYIGDKAMLMVQVEMLGRSCSVEVDAAWLERMPKAA